SLFVLFVLSACSEDDPNPNPPVNNTDLSDALLANQWLITSFTGNQTVILTTNAGDTTLNISFSWDYFNNSGDIVSTEFPDVPTFCDENTGDFFSFSGSTFNINSGGATCGLTANASKETGTISILAADSGIQLAQFDVIANLFFEDNESILTSFDADNEDYDFVLVSGNATSDTLVFRYTFTWTGGAASVTGADNGDLDMQVDLTLTKQ
ncbi:MAG: hypothetical protein AAFU64_15500, partial [Bacteroidota bacterium]